MMSCTDLLMIFPVVWKASSTIASSWSDAARWNTLKIFFHPDLMLWAWEFTIWAMQRTTISRIVGDLDIMKINYSSVHIKSEKYTPICVNTFPKHSLCNFIYVICHTREDAALVTLQTFIHEVLGLNLGWYNGYPEWGTSVVYLSPSRKDLH